jgi:hypothetical protein
MPMSEFVNALVWHPLRLRAHALIREYERPCFIAVRA